jgi:ABC-type antimicrobial peptide transport system ATPase subunit
VSLRSLGLLQSTDLARPVAELSMGQQRRLDLALALAARPHLLLLDEPTNHLSIALVDELTHALDTTPAAVVIVTHDRQLRRDLHHWPTIELQVDDVQQTTTTLSEAGAELVAPPTRTPWRSVNSRLNAPGSLQITLFQELDDLTNRRGLEGFGTDHDRHL